MNKAPFKNYTLTIQFTETLCPKHFLEVIHDNVKYTFVTGELTLVLQLLNGENTHIGYIKKFMHNTTIVSCIDLKDNSEISCKSNDLFIKLREIGIQYNAMRFNKFCEKERIVYYK